MTRGTTALAGLSVVVLLAGCGTQEPEGASQACREAVAGPTDELRSGFSFDDDASVVEEQDGRWYATEVLSSRDLGGTFRTEFRCEVDESGVVDFEVSQLDLDTD